MIVGTAGHVDHGKTALVQALTGVDTDRLAEEKRRGISIDLGFAYTPLGDGTILGFVDVPGHEKFMRNMISGAASIDLVMLVVAADDGVMPQTREHLWVSEMLGVERAIVAISKCDLVDSERIERVRRGICEVLQTGVFASSEIVEVAVHEGRGLARLRELLEAAASQTPFVRPGPTRFAIDRSFTLPGAGTVLTGTLVQGEMGVGDTLAVSPGGSRVRVRDLRVQDRDAERAHAGQRCGVALGGRVPRAIAGRGDWLLDPGLDCPTDRIDVELALLPTESRPLRHWTPVRFHHGAAERVGRVALLQDRPLDPGSSAMAQLVLEAPIAAAVNDRFVIRTGDGARTIGGGRMIDLRPPRRRRKQARRLAQLSAMAIVEPSASLDAQLSAWPHHVIRSAFLRDRALAELPRGTTSIDAGEFLYEPTKLTQIEDHILARTADFHARRPRLLGPGFKHLKEELLPPLPDSALRAILDRLTEKGSLAHQGGFWRLPCHRPGLDKPDQDLWHQIMPLLDGDARFRPPLQAEISATLDVGEVNIGRILAQKGREGVLAEIADGRFLLASTLHEIAGIIGELATAGKGGLIAAADLRDRLDNGRKVAIQILEYFDRQAITARRGDLRVVDYSRLARYLQD